MTLQGSSAGTQSYTNSHRASIPLQNRRLISAPRGPSARMLELEALLPATLSTVSTTKLPQGSSARME